MANRLLLLIMALTGVVSCSSKGQRQGIPEAIDGKRVLVAYYSWGGNTKAVGDYIADKIWADIYEIETLAPYPADYDECVRKVGEQGCEYIPELKPGTVNIDDYDVVFIGSPCWWGTIANPVRSFIMRHDFTGKTVIPFMTAGTSGKRLQEIPQLCKGANIMNGIGLYNCYQVKTTVNTPDNMGDWKTKVDKWLNN